jgi:16S rRNA A1518/A1519 N6-dimethyltransferase RsmA/KsgA/DIM1 with predicted DNA glycosylase/AP lyase activity
MKANTRLSLLLDKYIKGEIDLIEQDELFELIELEKFDDVILDDIQADLYTKNENVTASLPPYIAEEIIRKILKSEPAVNQIIASKNGTIFSFKNVLFSCVHNGFAST